MTSNNSNPHHTGSTQLVYNKSRADPMIIQPKDLNIVWGRDDRYWNIPSPPKANQDMATAPVELYQVSWLEVTACVNGTNPKRDYEVGFEVSLAPDAFGWGASPVYIMIKRGKDGKSEWRKFNVDPNKSGKFKIYGRLLSSQKKADQSSTDDNKLYFGLYEVWSGKWKGGLKIHNAYVTEI